MTLNIDGMTVTITAKGIRNNKRNNKEDTCAFLLHLAVALYEAENNSKADNREATARRYQRESNDIIKALETCGYIGKVEEG